MRENVRGVIAHTSRVHLHLRQMVEQRPVWKRAVRVFGASVQVRNKDAYEIEFSANKRRST